MEKDDIKSRNSKIYRKSFFKILLASLFILFFVLSSLPGCRLLFFPRTPYIENITAAKSSKIWEESVSSINIGVKQPVAGPADSGEGYRAGSSRPSESSICSEALNSFYDNLTEQLKLFKNKTGQSEKKAEKVTAKAAETTEQPAGQQNQPEAKQPASTPDQNAGFELALLNLINDARNNSGLPHLSLNSILNSIAKSRCDDMIARDYFSHITPDGKDIKSILAENGIMYKTNGENLQYCSSPSLAGAELFFNNWMESEIHRANILGSEYTQIGIALSLSADKAIAALVFLG